MDPAQAVADDGFVILEGVIPDGMRRALLAEVERLEADLGVEPAGNSFEGARTRRVYNLLVHGPVFEAVAEFAPVLGVVERVLDRGCLVSSLSSIAIEAGEVAQPIHADDQLIPIPRPHLPTVCNTMWALTDFTEANGATRIIPGSHRLDHAPVYGQHYDSVPAEMEAGSVLVWHGSLWHGGGANTTPDRRVGIAMNYCAGWIRQQENQQLGIPREVARGFSRRLRELVGYGVYTGLIGHIDKRSPADLLGPPPDGDGTPGGHGMVWDAAG